MKQISGHKSLINVSDKAKEIKSLTFKKLMITNGRRLFDTQIPINYMLTSDHIKKVEDMATRKNLDVSYNLSLVVDNIEVLCQINDSQSLISMYPLDDEDYLNLIN